MKLEIIINKKAKGFEAKSPNFPQCIGLGSTKELAFKDLKRQLKNKLCLSLRKSLDEILDEKNATPVITNLENENHTHQIFNILSEYTKQLIYKFPQNTSFPFPTKQLDHINFMSNITQQKNSDDFSSSLNPTLSSKENVDGIFFPISLN